MERVKIALSTMKTNPPDRDVAFWARHPGIVWSNPHASDAVMIGNALLRGNAATLAAIAEHFGTDVLWQRWRQLQGEYERFPSELKAVRSYGPRVEEILKELTRA